MNTLQTIIIAVSIVLAVLALLIFSGVLPGFRSAAPGQAGEVNFWGTIPSAALAPILADFGQRYQDIKVNYREQKEESYIGELIDALASGKGPDVFLLPQDQIFRQKDKILALDSQTYPLRTFRDNFIDLAEIYISSAGILGLPIQIDPLVLYWNRDLFSNAGLAQTPSFWDEFPDAVQKLKISDGQKIKQTGLAMGEFKNINNAKDILAMLMLQTGNKITDPKTLKPVFDERGQNPLSPIEEAILFFTSFSDPRKDTFSWSQAMPEALESFATGNLAMYIGYASDLEKILAGNPHLNFGVREVPQIRGGPIQATFARSWALAVSRQSKNPTAALTFIFDMTGYDQQKLLAQNSLKPPALRSLLAEKPKEPALEIFYLAAIRSRAWLDPDPAATRIIWQDAAKSALSGAKNLNEAASDASRKFDALVPAPN
jgi:ABC-type glycerol-3-phosphate transport system substrate-binding protein